MKFEKEGVLLTFEEYAEVMRALQALAALRPATSFNTTTSQPTVEVEP